MGKKSFIETDHPRCVILFVYYRICAIYCVL